MKNKNNKGNISKKADQIFIAMNIITILIFYSQPYNQSHAKTPTTSHATLQPHSKATPQPYNQSHPTTKDTTPQSHATTP